MKLFNAFASICVRLEPFLLELDCRSPWRARCILQGLFSHKTSIPGDSLHVSNHLFMFFADFLCLQALGEQAASRSGFFTHENWIPGKFEHGHD